MHTLFVIFAVIVIGMCVFTITGMAVAILLMAWRASLAAWSRKKQGRLATRPVGLNLVTQVTNEPDRGRILSYGHRDYCGMGLKKEGNLYLYGEVYDGRIAEPDDAERVFNDRALFIDWLRQQTDQSLAGDGNQRLATSRLRLFVAGSIALAELEYP